MSTTPDLHTLAQRAQTLYEAINDFGDEITEAYDAALGEWDSDRDESVEGTASGDDAGYFEKAKQHVGEARFAISHVQELLATVQGWREFSESGSVSA